MPVSAKPWYRHWRHVCLKKIRAVTRLEDTPYRIAMGCACGLFSSMLPIFGQMLVGMLLARIFRANVIASIPWTWLTNPATTLPIWYGAYLVGAALTRHEPVTWTTLQDFATRIQHDGLTRTLHAGGALLGDVLPSLLLGTVIVGIGLGAVGYLCIGSGVRRIQAHRTAKIAYWQERTRSIPSP
jgi:uncharacterized protein